MKNHKKNRIFELRFSNLFLAVGIVLCAALSIASSFLLGGFIDFLSGKPTFDHDTLLYLIAILGALLIAIISNIFLGQFLPLKLQLKRV